MLILPCIRNPVNLASCLTAVPFYFRNRICQQNVFLRIGDQRLDLALFLIPVAFQIHIVNGKLRVGKNLLQHTLVKQWDVTVLNVQSMALFVFQHLL